MHVIILSILYCLLASVESPLPPKAQTEIDASNKAVVEVKQNLLKKLTPILAETTKKGDLEGAVALKKYMDAVQEDVKAQTGDLLGNPVQVDGKWRTSRGYIAIVKDGKIAYSDGNYGEATVKGNRITFNLVAHWKGTISFDVKGDGPWQCTENGVPNVYTIERVKE